MQRRQSAGSMSSIAAGRPGDAGIVDQHVEPAELRAHIVEQPVDRGLVRDVGQGGPDAGLIRPQRGQAGSATSQTMDPRARLDQRIDDGPADAGGTGGDQHPLSVGSQLGHAVLPLLMRVARAVPGPRPGRRARK